MGGTETPRAIVSCMFDNEWMIQKCSNQNTQYAVQGRWDRCLRNKASSLFLNPRA